MARGADAVVIGAGAAGIAAARLLHDAGRDVLLLEGSERIGGRAQTIRHGGARLDLGCGWLHSARRNPWTAIAEARGFASDHDAAHWDEQWRDLGFAPEEQRAFATAWDRLERDALAAEGPDRPLSDFVGADARWRPLFDNMSGFINGAPLARVSLHDWRAYEEAASDDNWAVCDGYGTLIADHARGISIRTGTPATRIDRGGRRLRVETPDGTIETAAVIVAVPTTILAEQRLTFDPPLPDKHDAAAALPLGLADKAFLAVDGDIDWPANAHLIGNPHAHRTASYRLAPLGFPVVEAFFGGDTAEQLEAEDAAAFAIDELVALLGSDWRPRLHPIRTTRWRQVDWIGGSYSHARIGHAAARATLAAPIDDRLFFAGEACSRTDFSTAHGAYETGVAAARAILGA